MRAPVANSENRAFDDTKGQKFVRLNLNLSSVKAFVVIFYYKTDSVEFKKKDTGFFFYACCLFKGNPGGRLHNFITTDVRFSCNTLGNPFTKMSLARE